MPAAAVQVGCGAHRRERYRPVTRPLASASAGAWHTPRVDCSTRVCVFCGSSPGRSPAYAEAAAELGAALAGVGSGSSTAVATSA